MTLAEKFTGTNDTYAGKEMYQYCLSCDGAMSTWRTFGPGSQTYPSVWRQYEYDGLNLLRVDERCDNDKDGIIEAGETTWRTVEVNTHKPGALGALIGKRVYVYSDAADSSPNGSNDYTYTYDALGNVQVVYKASGTVGQEAYFFTQDAFGNELSSGLPSGPNCTNLYGSSSWAIARTAGITEHQTGKIQSAFSGLYYFNARWYDPLVGRFVGRDQRQSIGGEIYAISSGDPVDKPDPSGMCASCGYPTTWYSPSPIETPTPPNEPTPEPGPIPPWRPPVPKPFIECKEGVGEGAFLGDSATHYGNWCGEGGPEWKDPFRFIFYFIYCPPVDDLDRCCLEHDLCYFIHGQSYHYFWEEKPKAERECDNTLCNCSKEHTWKGTSEYKENLEWLFCNCHYGRTLIGPVYGIPSY